MIMTMKSGLSRLLPAKDRHKFQALLQPTCHHAAAMQPNARLRVALPHDVVTLPHDTFTLIYQLMQLTLWGATYHRTHILRSPSMITPLS